MHLRQIIGRMAECNARSVTSVTFAAAGSFTVPLCSCFARRNKFCFEENELPKIRISSRVTGYCAWGCFRLFVVEAECSALRPAELRGQPVHRLGNVPPLRQPAARKAE